jgi:hypothetical protein
MTGRLAAGCEPKLYLISKDLLRLAAGCEARLCLAVTQKKKLGLYP